MRYANTFIPLLILLLLTSCFRTSAPVPRLEPSNADDSVTFAIIGDYGVDQISEADVAALVDSWNVDFVATVGDNNYNNGAASTIDQNIGKYYSKYIKPYVGSYGSGSPDINRFWPALGNHDWFSVNCSAGVCTGPYMDYFELPNNERYYDVQIGPVHLFIVDSYFREPDGITADSVQANWLKNSLAASDAPHKLVLMHHAPYSSSSNHGSDPTFQWPFESWGATAVFAGHDHHYERLKIGNIPYFVNGAGGRRLYTLGPLLPQTEVAYDDDFGAMRMMADSNQIRYEFFNRRGVLIDSYIQLVDGSLTLSRQIASANDDAEENRTGSVYLSSTDLELVSDTGFGYINQTVGMRFSDISIPQGVSITNAYLEFTVDDPGSDPTSLQFVGEAADNANTFSSAAFDVSSRPRTAAQVNWNDVPPWPSEGEKQQSPNLASIIQEIVNRNSWESGNALAIIVTGSGRRTADSRNRSAQSAPRLVVQYTQNPPSNQPPTIERPSDQQSLLGQSVSVQINASDPDGDPLSFNASGLPSGVSLNSQSGLISGTPGAAGDYSVTVSVSDGAANVSTSFDWRVGNAASMQTFSAQVAFREDDAEEYLTNGSIRINSTDLELGVERQPQAVGIRFRNVRVPAGAVVTQAYLSFTAEEADSGSTSVTIHGEASNSAAAYSQTSRDITRRPLTASNADWSNIPPWSIGQIHDSPDLSTVVQEIINRPGWREGNALAFVITGTGERTAESYNGSRTQAPRLVIDYQTEQPLNSVDIRIASGVDDAEQRLNGSIYRNSTDLELTDDRGEQTVGLRFAGVAIPSGATITNAYLQFKAEDSSSETTQLSLQTQAADNAEPFEYVDNSISNRPRSNASVSWSPAPWPTIGEAGAAQRTPNLASIIQEVVSRPGWQPGNSLGIIITGTGRRVAESFDGDAAGAPLLHVDFQ